MPQRTHVSVTTRERLPRFGFKEGWLLRERGSWLGGDQGGGSHGAAERFGPALLFQAEIGISADEAAGSRAPRGNEQLRAACVTRSDPLLFSRHLSRVQGSDFPSPWRTEPGGYAGDFQSCTALSLSGETVLLYPS